MLLPVAVPVLFWGWYHYHKDRHLPEPASHLALALGLGVVAAGISKALYVGLGYVSLRHDALLLADNNTIGLFAYAMLVIGPVEEMAKLLPFLAVVLRFREFDEPLDGIIYASFIALGYAAVENVFYLQYLTPIEAVARGFAAPVLHILCASIWGYAIGIAWLRHDALFVATTKGFLLAAGLHGVYDFIVLQNAFNALPIAAAIVITVWVWRLRLMQMLHRDATQAAPQTDRDA